MKTRHVYLLFCALGILLPYSQFVPCGCWPTA